jgi:pyruvate formate lyase activating enzyme
VKVINEEVHRKTVGSGSRLIQENLIKLSKTGKDIWIRVPVVSGVNDTVEEMEKIADFIKGLERVKLVELLSFHNLGGSKYERLGFEYGAEGYLTISDQLMDILINVIQKRGLPSRNVWVKKEVVISFQ